MNSKTNPAAVLRPARRLVPTKNLNREDWLKQRQQGIGASEAAAAVGLSPYQSQLELWMLKTGRMQPEPEPSLEEVRSPLYWGQVLEPLVAHHYSQLTGHKVRRVNAILQHADEDKAWMLANLDYAVVKNDQVQILECKTAGEYGIHLWKDGVPEYVQCQVQHQLAVTGKQAADVAVLLAGQSFKTFRIERDEILIQELIELERQFWRWVETDTPPPADGSESAQKALQALFPEDNGTVLDWTEEASELPSERLTEINQAFDQLNQFKEQINQLKAREEACKQKLQQALGEATQANLKGGKITWKRSKDAQVLDAKRLQEDLPQLYKDYLTTRPGSRRFLIKPQ